MVERECKTCNRTLEDVDFYRYVTGRLYTKCKKCHNKGRNNYARKRDHSNQAPSNPTILNTTSSEEKFFAFDFISMVEKLLKNPSGVQTDISSTNPQEVKISSSGSTTSA